MKKKKQNDKDNISIDSIHGSKSKMIIFDMLYDMISYLFDVENNYGASK